MSTQDELKKIRELTEKGKIAETLAVYLMKQGRYTESKDEAIACNFYRMKAYALMLTGEVSEVCWR